MSPLEHQRAVQAAMQEDQIILPRHYARWKIEPVHFIGENGLDFLRGSIIKYLMRWDAKGGMQDLYKARRYLEMYIAQQKGERAWAGPPAQPELPLAPPAHRPLGEAGSFMTTPESYVPAEEGDY